MNKLIIPCSTGDVSDGYHTFDELYRHRCLLFLSLMKSHPAISWFSERHNDGSKMDGWFVAGMRLPDGDITYHLPNDMLFGAECTKAEHLLNGPPWDGHTSADVIDRLGKFLISG
jgi:hypothetical protein